MRSFNRVKTINGIEYLYKITPYYDPKTKRIRHRSKYLGKNVDGKAVKVRAKPPRMSYSYGEFLPLLDIIKDLKLAEILSQHLAEKEVQVILTLAQNRILKPIALYHIASWNEGTMLSKIYGELPLSSQSLSNLLNKIGESDLHLRFSQSLIQNLSTKATLIYDVTSLSSYSNLINLLEYGYNRDNLDVPQVNLSVVLDKARGVPVMYDIYPGSVVDVTTLQNTITKVKNLGIQEVILVLDRGFYSTTNLEALLSNDFAFILPAPLTVKVVKQLLSSVHREIQDANLLKMYNGEPLFVKPIALRIKIEKKKEVEVKGYVYYNQKREQSERELFYRKLYEVVEKLRKVKIEEWMEPRDLFGEIAGKLFSPYLKYRVVNWRFEVSVRKKAVAQRVNRMGKFLLLYEGSFDWIECLTTYRGKDLIEKGFDTLKNDLELLPLNVQKENTLKGALLINFLALIIRMRLMKQMQEHQLIEKYTIGGLLLELEKIKKIELTSGETFTTELTKKQKEILEKLKLCA